MTTLNWIREHNHIGQQENKTQATQGAEVKRMRPEMTRNHNVTDTTNVKVKRDLAKG